MNNIANQVAFLRTSREFPEDLHQRTVEVNKSYLDIAQAVNNRIISIFPVSKSAITGESWFLTNQRRQTLRQVYTFTSTASIPHGIPLSTVNITRAYGEYTDGTNWYGVLFGSNVAVAGQLSFYITPNNIVFVVGGGPGVTSGIIVLEWMSQV